MTWLDEKTQVTAEKKMLFSDIYPLNIKVVEENSINT